MSSFIEEEYEAYSRERSWPVVYTRIKNEASILHRDVSIKVAKLPQNRDRNRYRDVSPYDDYRVKLENSENDYINASLVRVPLSKRSYILTQGPLEHTSCHFWLMVWQQNTKGVLMLNKVVENGRLKCHLYYPMGADHGGDGVMDFPEVGIKVEFVTVDDFSYFVRRTLKLKNTNTDEERTIYQFHYTSWPDFDVPQSSEAFLAFLFAVRRAGVLSEECGPAVIHCSAGIGRSGTFCLVDSALVIAERTKSLAALDIRSMLLDMRQYRCGLIQTHDQLRFSYMAIIDGAKSIINKRKIEENETEINSEKEVDQTTAHNEANHSESSLSDVESEEEDDEERLIECEANDTVPEPPERTTSLRQPDNIPQRNVGFLQKAHSLDQELPPAVPPRPPSAQRQVSEPAGTTHVTDHSDEEDTMTKNAAFPAQKSPILQKREERKKKTQAIVDRMKANQAAAKLNNTGGHWSSRLMWTGLAVSVAAAAAVVMWWKN